MGNNEVQQGCEHGPWIPASLCGAVLTTGDRIVEVGCPGGPHKAPVEGGVIQPHHYGSRNERCHWHAVRVVLDLGALREAGTAFATAVAAL